MTMPRPRPTHLWRMRTRHGAIAWYFCRQRGDKKIRIRGEYGSAEFQAAYEAALTGTPPSIAEASKTKPHSLAWLIEQYRNTTAWADLSPATRRNSLYISGKSSWIGRFGAAISLVLQSRVFPPCFFQRKKIRIGILPQGEERRVFLPGVSGRTS